MFFVIEFWFVVDVYLPCVNILVIMCLEHVANLLVKFGIKGPLGDREVSTKV